MARAKVVMNRTASTTLSLGAAYCPASSMRRFGVYEYKVGSDATPADAVFRFEFPRTSTVGTIGSSVTPNPTDSAEAALVTLAAQAYSADPTLGALMDAIPLNQRATFRDMAYDRDDQIIVPATANNGLAVRTPVASSLVSVYCRMSIDEH